MATLEEIFADSETAPTAPQKSLEQIFEVKEEPQYSRLEQIFAPVEKPIEEIIPTPIEQPAGLPGAISPEAERTSLLLREGGLSIRPGEPGAETPEIPPLTAGEVLVGAVKSTPRSAADFAKSLFTAVANPIDTASAIVDITAGAGAKLSEEFTGLLGIEPLTEKEIEALPEKTFLQRREKKQRKESLKKQQSFELLSGTMKERFGGVENIKRTIATDPVGFLADVSGLISGGSAALKSAAKATGITTGLNRLETAGKIGRAIEPIEIAIKVTKPIGRQVGTMGSKILGNITTGVGAEAMQQAYRGSRDFIRALRGEIDNADILKSAKGSLDTIKDRRNSQYRTRLEKIKGIDRELDVLPVHNELTSQMKRFGVKIKPDNTLDFSRSTLNRNSFADVEEIFNRIKSHGTQIGDLTPLGLDTLKRFLDDFYSESKNSRALVASLRKKTTNLLEKEVPQYKRLTKDYAQVTKLTDEIEKALSLGKKASADTAIRKLSSTMRENFEFRKSLLDELDRVADIDLKGAISGVASQSWTPKGLVGKLAGGATSLNVLFGGLGKIDPAIALTLAASSPRAVSEFLNIFGKSIRTAQKQGKFVAPAPARQVGFQAGRVVEEQQRQKKLEEIFRKPKNNGTRNAVFSRPTSTTSQPNTRMTRSQ